MRECRPACLHQDTEGGKAGGVRSMWGVGEGGGRQIVTERGREMGQPTRGGVETGSGI